MCQVGKRGKVRPMARIVISLKRNFKLVLAQEHMALARSDLVATGTSVAQGQLRQDTTTLRVSVA